MSSGRIKRIERLWINMQALYGSRWLLEYGQATDKGGQLCEIAEIWAKSLDDATHDQLATGIRKCTERDSEHPPSLPEFLRLCGKASRPSLPAYAETPPSNRPPAEPYRDLPADRCARMADAMAEEAQATLKGGPDPDLPEEIRRKILRGYWMTKLGETLVGQALAKRWEHQEEAA